MNSPPPNVRTIIRRSLGANQRHFTKATAKGEKDRWQVIKTVMKNTLRGVISDTLRLIWLIDGLT
jgi:hypothetical protein